MASLLGLLREYQTADVQPTFYMFLQQVGGLDGLTLTKTRLVLYSFISMMPMADSFTLHQRFATYFSTTSPHSCPAAFDPAGAGPVQREGPEWAPAAASAAARVAGGRERHQRRPCAAQC